MEAKRKLKMRYIAKTCNAVPAQWEGFTKGGYAVYIRYRFGIFEVLKSHKRTKNNDDAVLGKTIMIENIGNRFDCDMDTKQMKELTKSILDFSECVFEPEKMEVGLGLVIG